MISIYLTFVIENKKRTVGLLMTSKSVGANKVVEHSWQALGTHASAIFPSTSTGGNPKQPTGKLVFASPVGADIRFAGKVIGRIETINNKLHYVGPSTVSRWPGKLTLSPYGSLDFDWGYS